MRILLWLVGLCASVLAFATLPTHAFELRVTTAPAPTRSSFRSSSRPLMRIVAALSSLILSASASDADDDTPDEGGAPNDMEGAASNEADAAEKVAVEEEDPELVALKQQIADLESAVKAKRRQAASARDMADEFTKDGYARKVAEMENMRRARSVRAREPNRSYGGSPVHRVGRFGPSLLCWGLTPHSLVLVLLLFFMEPVDVLGPSLTFVNPPSQSPSRSQQTPLQTTTQQTTPTHRCSIHRIDRLPLHRFWLNSYRVWIY